MSDSPTPETPPSRLGRILRLPRLSGKASAACLVAFFLATGLLIPGVVRLPLWIDFEIVLAIWWLGWLVVLAVLLYRGQRVTDTSFPLCFNAHYEDITVRLPGNGYGQEWTVVLDTATGEAPGPPGITAEGDAKITITARSMVVLERSA